MAGVVETLVTNSLSVTLGLDKSVHDDLRKLCQRIDTLSRKKFLLHPTKCRCLLQSYRLLLHPRFFIDARPCMKLTSLMFKDPPFFLPRIALVPFMRALWHTLQEGERFLQNCTFLPGWKDLFTPARRQWLINKAIPIVLSTEIVDVHLHDFVGCMFAMVRMVWTVSIEAPFQEIEDGLKEIWASADDEGDARRMRALFTNIKSKELKEISKLICLRLSDESTSKAQLNLASTLSTSTSKTQLNLVDAIVPTYLWMDPPGFDSEMEKVPVLLSNHECEVVSIKSMGGQFACKCFQRSASEAFINEAVIQASLRHANLMHLLWCTRRVGSHSLVMELMDEDLGQVIRRRRQAKMDPPFSLLAGIDIMLQVAKGMDYLHDLGIMHRDLKSLNILVRHSRHADNIDQLLTVKVADFGSSKVKRSASLFTSKDVGTSIWRAPELLDCEDETKYTKKADVYSFAIVCSEILTGLPAPELLPCARMSDLPGLLKEGRRPQLPSSCPPAIANYIQTCWDGDASKRPTFKHTCKVLRGFKACLLSGKTKVLESSHPHMFNEWPDFQIVEAERGSQGRSYEPVISMLCEMNRAFATHTR